MTTRTNALRYPAGTTKVGTARVREDMTVGRSFAEREILRRTCGRPNSEFDDIAAGGAQEVISRSVTDSAAAARDIGTPTSLGRVLTRLTTPAGAKASKYRNEKCESDGIKFDSKREMMRWRELVQMQSRGEIFGLELQVTFVLAPAVVLDGRKKPALKYIADFSYEKSDGETVIEDVKGRATDKYRIKRHLMKALLGLDIVEIK